MNAIEQTTISKISWRLLPLLMIAYFVAYLDRVNLGFAGASMSKDLGFTSTVFGNAAGIFFIAYFLLEVPSNLALERFGARRWIARIMFTWGILSAAQAWVAGATSFNVVRFLLGAAEAGFFPGVIFYLTLWFPSQYRARIVGWFMFAVPISTVIGSPISGYILNMDGIAGLRGWQWLFILEAIPALVLTLVVLFYLPDGPDDAKWLSTNERAWLKGTLVAERRNRESLHKISWKQTLFNWRVIGLGFVYMGITVPLYGLGFFLPQIIKGFGGLTNVEIGFINAFPYLVGAIAMVLWTRWSDARRERKWFLLVPLVCIIVGLVAAAEIASPIPKMAAVTLAAFGIFTALPVFWTIPTALLSGVAAAAGIAWINSIGNLGGYIGPTIFGLLKDKMGNDFYAVLFLALLAVVAFILVLLIGHDPRAEKAQGATVAA
ncbi:MFS transporter [Variovorax sp. Sphag1AA]|uniref:MFS transporter n=1 Tax=Variovorax sp. Sphag1AA TaxID=2587027 RepID=UPI001607262C|nr:MFS transporter [Variovorax sp. Sphag1AA]MBB3181192.1 D-galactonate transporter [Variovorax sp. Sphag1AA]